MITAIIGRPGSGKTYRMVYYVYQRRLRGPLDVATNIGSLVERGLPGVGRLDYVDSMREAFALHHCTLLLDEAHLWFGSAERASHGPEYADWVSQLRKIRLDLLYTSQASGAVDKLLRDRTDATCLVTSFVKLGFFSYCSYDGMVDLDRIGARRWVTRGYYWYNPFIAACYDTTETIANRSSFI